MKKTILFLAWTLVPAALLADNTSEELARQTAAQFWTGDAQAARRSAAAMPLSYAPEGGELYVFNNPDGQGWVMVTDNDAAPSPILAYSDKGRFDYAKAPDATKAIIARYAEGLRQLPQADGNTAKRAASRRASVRRRAWVHVVEPLLRTTWNQTTPYNNLCPVASDGGMDGYGGRCPTGCVPTAIVQIMNYWQWPKQGSGSHANRQYPSQQYDFSQSTYDWDNMLDNYTEGSYNEAQAQAVAKLMADVGCAVNADYRPAETPTSTAVNLKDVLVKYFDYSVDMDYGFDVFKRTGKERLDILKDEIIAKRPVLAEGQLTTGIGHDVVADGYEYFESEGTTTDYFHLNFGWGGKSDGFYLWFDPTPDALYGPFRSWWESLVFIRPSNQQRVSKDNVFFNIQGDEAQAMCCIEGTAEHAVKIDLPSTVEVDGRSYPVTSIYPAAFQGAYISDITFPGSIKRIPDELFGNSLGYRYVHENPLRSVTFNEGLEEIGDSAFADCQQLGGWITFPSTLRQIGDSAFVGLASTSVEFKGTGFRLGRCALTSRSADMTARGLEGAARISSHGIGPLIGDFVISPTCQYDDGAVTGRFDNIILPAGLTNYNPNMFGFTSSTAAYTVRKDNPNYTSANGMLFDKQQTTLIGFPGLETTESGLRYRSVAYIPSSVTRLAPNAVPIGPSVVQIPMSVQQLDGAFTNCTTLRHLYMLASTPPTITDGETFPIAITQYGTCKLYVPHGTKSAYQQANGWKDFQNIEEQDTYAQGQFVYNLADDVASVVGRNSTVSFDGHAKVPASITIGGKNYTVVNIEQGAFDGDPALQTLTLPKTVEYVGCKFVGCSQFYEFIVETGHPSMYTTDGMLFLKNYYGENELECCPPMQRQGSDITPRTRVSLPAETQVIGNGGEAFGETLRTIVIPATVERMEYRSFLNCTSLTSVICLGTPPPAYTESDHTFTLDVRKNATFYVPQGTTAAYGSQWIYREILDNVHVVEFDPATFNPNTIGTDDPLEPDDPGFYDPSSIRPIVNSKSVNSQYYDLQGRRVEHPTKGIYIVGGRKIIIR